MPNTIDRTLKKFLRKNFISLEKPSKQALSDCQSRINSFSTRDILFGHRRSDLLFQSCHDTSLSALLLYFHEEKDNGDILARSVLEGTLLLFRILSEKSLIEERSRAYSIDLFEAPLAQEAEKMENSYDPSHDMSLPDLLSLGESSKTGLPDYFAQSKSKYPKGVRKKLLSEWSSGSILNTPEFHRLPKIYRDSFRAMYAFTSHLAHMDPNGQEIRYLKESFDKEQMHYFKLMGCASSVLLILHLAKMRLSMLMWATNALERYEILANGPLEKRSLLACMVITHRYHLKYGSNLPKSKAEYLQRVTRLGEAWVNS